MFYNTMGDNSNCRCVPYHKEKRYEMYALRDIKKGEELTIRYDSMNWRAAMKEVKSIVGELKGEHKKLCSYIAEQDHLNTKVEAKNTKVRLQTRIFTNIDYFRFPSFYVSHY